MLGSGGEDCASERSSVKTSSTGDAAGAHLSQAPPQGPSVDDAGDGSRRAASAAVSVENQVARAAFGSTDGGSDFVLGAVLFWTLAEATDGNHYKSKIKRMPTKFNSIEHYKQVLSDFLIEEVHARVHLGIEQIKMADFYHVISVLDVDSSEHLFIDIDVARLSRQGRINHSAKDGDVFLLTMQSPEDVNLGDSCFLGVVMEVGDDNFFQKSFRILVSRKHNRSLVKSVKFVSFLTNIAQELTIAHCISSGDFNAIKLILEKSESCSTCCSQTEELIQSDRYNQDQVHCITSILSKMSCQHENSVQLVWGSPGTGKTLLACALMNFLINSENRILVCVPREKNISTLLSSLKHEFPEFDFSNLIVLNGLNDDFSATCLPHKSKDLYCAVHLWKSFTKEMAWILGLELYIPKVETAGEHTTGETIIAEFYFPSFKAKFIQVLKEVKVCSNAMISSLSRKGLPDQDFNKINNMISMLSRFQNLMEDHRLSAAHVKIAFDIPESPPCPSNSKKIVSKTAYDLNETRIRCIELIKDTLGTVTIPELDDRKDLEQFCIKHSQIIVCTSDYSSQLHNLDIKLDIMIADDAARIQESSLLVPLTTAPRHIVLIGDHLHVQPVVESKVCRGTGYGISLFERLINLSFDKKILREQHVMNPILSKVHGKLFYEDGISDGLNVLDDYNEFLKDLRFGPFSFLDMSDVEELRTDGTSFVESSLIMLLLEDLCKGLANSEKIISVGIVCLCSKRANALKDELCAQYEGHNNICLEVICMEKLQIVYDIVILSSVCKDTNLLLEDRILNVFLSSSRHCIWIVGEAGILLSSNGALEKLAEHIIVCRIDSDTISQYMQQLKMYNKDCPADTRNYLSHKTGQEYIWKGRPYRTKNILPPVRDQKDDRDTCTINTVLGVFESSKKVQYADFDPPKDFQFSMSLPHLKEQYQLRVDAPFLETDKSERGRRRLEVEMEVLKKEGVKGYNNIEAKEGIFKIARYEKLELKKQQIQFSDIKEHLRTGKMLACHFRLSTNYFYLKPGECYEFDAKNAFIKAKTQMIGSHAVMGTGFGLLPSAVPKGSKRCHVTFQNSEGPKFGYDGSGKVRRESLRGAYIMCPEEDSSIESTSVEGAPGAGVLVQVAQPGEQGPP